jgi:hypothetical protein
MLPNARLVAASAAAGLFVGSCSTVFTPPLRLESPRGHRAYDLMHDGIVCAFPRAWPAAGRRLRAASILPCWPMVSLRPTPEAGCTIAKKRQGALEA